MANHVPGWSDRTNRAPEKDKIFLDALAQGVSISRAARRAGYSYTSVYDYKREDEEFARLWKVAHEVGTDLYVDEAQLRSTKGRKRPVFYKGEICGHIREYSDNLLRLILASRRPDVYGRAALSWEPTGEGDGASGAGNEGTTIIIKGGLPKR